MLQRLVYIERYAILGGCILAPVLACLWTYQHKVDLNTAAFILASCIAVLTALGAIMGLIVHRMLALGNVQWGGNEETSALVKTAIGELIGSKPDKKINDAAIAQANAQEGRATAIYLSQRLLQLRQQGIMRVGKGNPIPAKKRIFWSGLALLIGCAVALVPTLLHSSALYSNTHLLTIALLSPLWLTGAAIAGLGLARANAWLLMLKPGARQPKLRARANRSTAGQWHKKDSRSDIPVLHIALLVPVVIAAALYLLREYGPDLSKSSTETTPSFNQETPDIAANTPPSPVRRAPTPVPQLRARNTPSPSAPTRTSRRAALAQRNWPIIPANGSLLQADEESLSYAGWDIAVVSRSLDEAKQRINQGYRSHLRDNPQTIGKIALQLTLQPSGGISDVIVLATEFDDPAFVNNLRDRLEAVSMPAGAIDPVSVLLSMDFRP